ncbi:uncharacterized protein [Lolium perenne]|uniref:uncharacterized protein n=1 Tax=Lolium perenne TaxID=4522 RepID=UPI003A98E3C2
MSVVPPQPPAALPIQFPSHHFPSHPILNVHITDYIKFQVNSSGANFSKWRQIFVFLMTMYKVMDHVTEGAAPPNPDDTWRAVDIHLSLWIMATLSDDLHRLVKGADGLALTTWTRLQRFFLANKDSRYLFLSKAFRSTPRGDMTVATYAGKLQSIADDLAALGRPVDDRDLAHQFLDGLGEAYLLQSEILKGNPPLPPFAECISRIQLAEVDVKSQQSHGTTAFIAHGTGDRVQPQGAGGGHQQQQSGGGGPQHQSGGGGRGRGRGQQHHHFGQGSGGGQPQFGGRGGQPGSSQHPWFGYFAPVGAPFPPARSTWVPPNAASVLGPRPGAPSSAYPVMYSATTPAPYQQLPQLPYQQHSSPHYATTPYSFDYAAMIHDAASNSGYQPPPPEWVMDSGASSHVTGKTGNLTTSHSSLGHLNSQYITVGNGSKLPILAVGSVKISSLPLTLQNVLVSPQTVKNLISVRQFTRDNLVSIEFDPFGFSVKDLATKTLLLRSNSDDGLYPFFGDKNSIPMALTTTTVSTEDPVVTQQPRRIHLGSSAPPTSYLPGLPVSGSSPAPQRGDTTPSPTPHQPHAATPPTSTPPAPASRRAPNLPSPSPGPPPSRAPSLPPPEPPLPPKSVAVEPPQNQHNMVTRGKTGYFMPKQTFSLHTSTHSDISPLPSTYRSALKDPNWHAAMLDEFNALMRNDTWSLVVRPAGVNVVTGKWIFRHKMNPDGTLARYKARWVVRGFTQQEGVDYGETFSPVVKPATIRTVLSIATTQSWPIHQMDVKNAFLHGHLAETVYCEQPSGFVDPTHPSHVCRLHKSLYGLKQAPRTWFHRFTQFITSIGFSVSKCDSSLFILKRGASTAYLLLYVDDIILTANTTHLLHTIISSLNHEFSMTDLGDIHHFLGINVHRTHEGLFLSQQQYTLEVLERAKMLNCHPISTPIDTRSKVSATDGVPFSDPSLYRSLAGALQYLTLTRPDLSYAVQQVCLFMHAPRDSHYQLIKRILRYIKGTSHYGLKIHMSSSMELIAYSDADWAGCPDTRKSTSGFCVFIGNNLVSWPSRRQPTVSQSSAEAEYRALANCIADCCWLHQLLHELHHPPTRATVVYCDNVSAMYMASNPVQHQRTKHIEIDLHFVRDRVALGEVRVLHVPTSSQFADIFTKGLPTTIFEEFRSSLNIAPSRKRTSEVGEEEQREASQTQEATYLWTDAARCRWWPPHLWLTWASPPHRSLLIVPPPCQRWRRDPNSRPMLCGGQISASCRDD